MCASSFAWNIFYSNPYTDLPPPLSLSLSLSLSLALSLKECFISPLPQMESTQQQTRKERSKCIDKEDTKERM